MKNEIRLKNIHIISLFFEKKFATFILLKIFF
jgi:hypothetical protein